MAPIFKPLVLASALFAALGSAAPVNRNMNKREDVVVWETVTTVVWTTVDVTTTIYPTQQAAGPTAPASVANVEPTSAPTPIEKQPVPTPAPVAQNQAQQQAQKQVEQQPQQQAEQQPQQKAQQPEQQPAPTAVPVPISGPAVQPQPDPSTTQGPAPVLEAPPPPPSATSSSTQPTSSSGGSYGSRAASSGYSGPCSKDAPCVGQATFYDTATSASNPSSCGLTNDGFAEDVLALPVGIMKDSDCGKTVTATYKGVTKTGIVVDKCMGCDNTSIDLSRHFFGELANFDEGRIHGVSWYIN